ncbi:MAG: hypothetical protein A3G75_09320 [Verrucomicrobia bacterium RIFCSPLOWO2_12_FULL_64_8]|nr:MAG: hypothetical protein A3G75_09320 [Verrucomicrobia bacterium RIFCSPLOWO2_12_FULL_64_8]
MTPLPRRRPGCHPRQLALVVATIANFGVASTVQISVKDEKGLPVEDAVVSLTALDGNAASKPLAAGQPCEIAQRDQEFVPFVTAVTVGTPIAFPNRDVVQHHVYSLSKPKKFELPLYHPGKSEVLAFDQPGVVTVGCNIHDWMLAYIVVLPTPYFAKTEAAGRAAVDAPAGRYRAEVWQPRLAAPVNREIVLAGTETAPLEFVLRLKPDRRIRRAPDAKSGGYR